MLLQEIRHMREIDGLVLAAGPEQLARLQAIDREAQKTSKSFYEACAEARIRYGRQTNGI